MTFFGLSEQYLKNINGDFFSFNLCRQELEN